MGRNAGDVDDAALAPRHHARPEFLARQQEAAHQVQVEIGPPILHRDLLELHLARHGHFRIVAPGGVDQHGDRPKGGLNLPGGLVQAGPRYGVRREKPRLAPGLFNALHAGLPALAVAAGHGDRRPGLGLALGQLSPQHPGGPDHDRVFS